MTTIEQMSKLKTHSKEWYEAAFENCKASPEAISASKRICAAYGISGQADPAYIANVIQEEIDKPLYD